MSPAGRTRPAGGRRRAGLLALLCLTAAIADPAAAGEALVTVQGANAVEVVDLEAGKVVQSIPVSGSP
ncbi:hypothetical protein OK884_11140, partial [Streptococcus pneumoniae]|nr:hypothetical protein [Streptococcus pneumoniae]